MQIFIPRFAMSVQVEYSSPESSSLDLVVCYGKSRLIGICNLVTLIPHIVKVDFAGNTENTFSGSIGNAIPKY